MEFGSIDIARKTGFFINKEEGIESNDKEIKMQKTIFSELRGVKDANKQAMLDWLKQKIHECDLKEYTIPRLD
jgi:hypothetical protein